MPTLFERLAPRRRRPIRPMALLLAFALVGAAPAAQGPLTLLDLDDAGVQGDRDALRPRLSADGRHAVFESDSTNLVPGIINTGHVFVRDRLANTTTLESVSSTGKKGNAPSREPDISGDGRFVAFTSLSTNLVTPDFNGVDDIFVRDRLLGTTERISVALGGGPGNGGSRWPSLSGDGRYVAFESAASDLVVGDDNGSIDVFVRDRLAGTTTLVSVTAAGLPADNGGFEPQLSADGRWVAFLSSSLDLTGPGGSSHPQVMLRDLLTGVTTIESVNGGLEPGNSSSWGLALSEDARVLAFVSGATNLVPGDTNLRPDAFVRDRTSSLTLRISVFPDGTQAEDVSGVLSHSLAITGDGTRVAFDTHADLHGSGVEESPDIYVYDLATDLLTCVTVTPGGQASDSWSSDPCFSRDGRVLAIESSATNLVPADANGWFVDALAADQPAATWAWLGHGLAGADGVPLLRAHGTLAGGSNVSLSLEGAAASAPLILFAALGSSPVAFKGGTLLAFPWIALVPLASDSAGELSLPFTWPAGVPASTLLILQAAIADAGAPAGVALTNALQGTCP